MTEDFKLEERFIKPNFGPVSDSAMRYRRFMVFYSSIALFLVFGSSGIDYENSSFLGIRFDGVNTTFVLSVILVSIIYFASCFILEGWHGFMECKLRLTGFNFDLSKKFMDQDSSDAERQSTLYSLYGYYNNRLQDLLTLRKNNPSISDISDEAIKEEIAKFTSMHSGCHNAIKRFDAGFMRAQSFKLLSWMCYEYCIPLMMAMIAALSLFFIELYPLFCLQEAAE